MDCSRIFGGVEARCLALHPCQPVVAVVRLYFSTFPVIRMGRQAAKTYSIALQTCQRVLDSQHRKRCKINALLQAALGIYAEFDIYSGCKLSSTEAAGTTLTMVYSADGTQLYVLTAVSTIRLTRKLFFCMHVSLCRLQRIPFRERYVSSCPCVQDRSLFTLSLPSWKKKVLLPPHKRYNMQKAHLALLGVRCSTSQMGPRRLLTRIVLQARPCAMLTGVWLGIP